MIISNILTIASIKNVTWSEFYLVMILAVYDVYVRRSTQQENRIYDVHLELVLFLVSFQQLYSMCWKLLFILFFCF
jgi:hypothetical protein